MTNILDYVDWRGDLSFRASPFNDVDALIFSKLAYFEFDGILPIQGNKGFTLREVIDIFEKKNVDVEKVEFFALKNAIILARKMAKTERYANIRLTNYVNVIDPEKDLQFSAVKIYLPVGIEYIAFRGTDDTMVGWKEDFNLSYTDKTIGQQMAVDYLSHNLPFFLNRLVIGGHSKGGNLAVYAASNVSKTAQEYIDRVYNFDGPGFNSHQINEEGYRRIKDKVVKIIPESSIIGMLLDTEENAKVVKSSNKSFMQHDASSWEVKGTSLVYVEDVTDGSVMIDETLKTWLKDLDDDERKEFVRILFSVFEKAGIEKATTIMGMNVATLARIHSVVTSLDKQDREILEKHIGSLLQTGTSVISDTYKRRIEKFLNIVGEKRKEKAKEKDKDKEQE